MDSELTRLRREHEANPNDPEAARAYERGLRQAGRPEEVRQLYAFKFQCDVEWDGLSPKNPGGDQRHCNRCSKDVHFVRNQHQLAERVEAGECVAFDPRDVDALGFLIDSNDQHPAQDPARPCLMEGQDPGPIPMPTAGIPMRLEPPPEPPEPLKGRVLPVQERPLPKRFEEDDG